MFKIIKKDRRTKARLGLLKTPHGTIKTPSYVIVATHARIKCLKPQDIKKTRTQVVIANTYHLWDRILNSRSKKFLTKNLGVSMPTMTDSGGFQVFSLGFGQENKVGKILNNKSGKIKGIRRENIKITEEGVKFKLDGKERFLDPELSIKLQEKIGADIIFAFDECTSPLDGFAYNKKAMARTHRWAERCLAARRRKDQLLFGIVQGGKFKNLRIQSAKFIGGRPFDGFGIGGSFGKNEMVKTLKWVIPYLPEDKPRHLLGIGRIEDVFNAVENGVDLFDCVIPTREARHGRIYTKTGCYDVRKKLYAKTKLHKLFRGNYKQKLEGQRLATMQNILFFNNLLEQIRNAIAKNRYLQFKKSFLRYQKRA